MWIKVQQPGRLIRFIFASWACGVNECLSVQQDCKGGVVVLITPVPLLLLLSLVVRLAAAWMNDDEDYNLGPVNVHVDGRLSRGGSSSSRVNLRGGYLSAAAIIKVTNTTTYHSSLAVLFTVNSTR